MLVQPDFILPSSDIGNEGYLLALSEQVIAVVVVETVDLAGLGFYAEVAEVAAAVEEYPMVEVVRNGVLILSHSRGITAGAEIAGYVQPDGGGAGYVALLLLA